MKTFEEIPAQAPETPLLDLIDGPENLRRFDATQLAEVADELRAFLLYTVGQTGGHFGAGLGVIELTLALHYVFNTPHDRLVWDVGHQTYPHKILTGRRERMASLRQWGGLAAFPCREESTYDAFGVGHSSTSISAALGIAIASELQGIQRQVVSIIGDGAMTAGMAFEALSHAGHSEADVLVILNDNQMSISENVGGLSNYFSRIWASSTYNTLKESGKRILEKHPVARDIARRTEEHMKGMISPGGLFEELGFNYIGPIDGHDLSSLVFYLKKMQALKGPRLLHVITQKGKGFSPAERDPIGYHALTKLEPVDKAKIVAIPTKKKWKFSNVFGQWLCDIAEKDSRVIGITPAMREGSDLVEFSKRFPKRYFDVAIAEQHAVTLAAGFACESMKPVVAIYSTFLQRAYDQLIHDIAIQNLDVLFAIDRAGLVGEDGATHNGSFDLSFLRCIPNLIIMAPADENECRHMLYTGLQFSGPAAVRYPRGVGVGIEPETEMKLLPIGQSHVMHQGQDIVIFAFGTLAHVAMQVAKNLNATLINMRFIKPLDEKAILQCANDYSLMVTLEENTISGGAGSAINEFLNVRNINKPVLNLGLPDQFLPHGKTEFLLQRAGLDASGIEGSIRNFLLDQGLSISISLDRLSTLDAAVY